MTSFEGEHILQFISKQFPALWTWPAQSHLHIQQYEGLNASGIFMCGTGWYHLIIFLRIPSAPLAAFQGAFWAATIKVSQESHKPYREISYDHRSVLGDLGHSLCTGIVYTKGMGNYVYRYSWRIFREFMNLQLLLKKKSGL